MLQSGWIFRRAETACPEDRKPRVRSIGNRFQRIVREALIAKRLVCPTQVEHIFALQSRSWMTQYLFE